MFTLFETPNPNRQGRFYYQRFETLRRRWQENLNRLQNYWQASGYGVNSEHVLSRLIGSFTISLDNDVRKYRDGIIDLTPQLCMANNIVAPTNGTIHTEKGWFYGLDDCEFILSVNSDFDPEHVVSRWRELSPVKVLRHTLTDVNMALPTGSVPDVDQGFVVISVDIPLLAVQYWGWYQHQLLTTDDTPERTQQFIGQYVLPGMLESQTTVGWFNALHAKLLGHGITPSKSVNSIAIPTNDVNNDLIVDQILRDSSINRMTYTELMACIPTATDKSMLGFLQPPKTIITRQNQWLLETLYVPYVNYALTHSELHDNTQNLSERNSLRRLVKRIRSDRIFDVVPNNARFALQTDFDFAIGLHVI